ncbi:MAG TPA: response regulator [Chitinophagaceae bacterium]|nr:response regulator [Chitinophagaceae bacterium]
MIKILIADDHPDMRQVLTDTLQEEFPGLYIEEAVSTVQLLEKTLPAHWDIVISDLYMPGGGAFYFLEKIKAAGKKIPAIIVLSMFPAAQYKQKVIEAGASEFIEKDTLPLPLLKAIRKYLDKV